MIHGLGGVGRGDAIEDKRARELMGGGGPEVRLVLALALGVPLVDQCAERAHLQIENRRPAVPERQLVPHRPRPVIMGVDEAGRDNQTAGLDDSTTGDGLLGDLDDPTVLDTNVCDLIKPVPGP